MGQLSLCTKTKEGHRLQLRPHAVKLKNIFKKEYMWTGDDSIIYLYEASQCMICMITMYDMCVCVCVCVCVYTCKLNIWILLYVL